MQIYMYTRCSQQKISQFFSYFAGNSRAQKLNKSQTKQANITYSIFIYINRWCPLCLLSFILSSFYFLTIHANLPFCIYLSHLKSTHPLPSRVVIININTASLQTSYKSLVADDPLHQPPRFWRRISCCACLCLWQNLPYPRLWRFFDATTVDDDRQLRPILCFLCQFFLTYPYHHPFIFALPPHSNWHPSQIIPPSDALLDKMTMRIWKDNLRNIRWYPIWRSSSASIWSMVPIQFRRLPLSSTFFVANPVNGCHQHPLPTPFYDLWHHHREIPVPPLHPLQHILEFSSSSSISHELELEKYLVG